MAQNHSAAARLANRLLKTGGSVALLGLAHCTVYPTTGYTGTYSSDGVSGSYVAPLPIYGGGPVYGGPVYAAPPPVYYTPPDPYYQQGSQWNQGGWPQGGGWRAGNQDRRGDNSGPPQRDFGGQRPGGNGDRQPGNHGPQQSSRPSPGPTMEPRNNMALHR